MFSASVVKKFAKMPSLPAPPATRASSLVIAALSSTVRVGEERMVVSLGSDLNVLWSLLRAAATESREEDFALAVYYIELD